MSPLRSLAKGVLQTKELQRRQCRCLELAPLVNTASLAVIAAYVPATAFAHVRSPIGFTHANDPAYVQLAAFPDSLEHRWPEPRHAVLR